MNAKQIQAWASKTGRSTRQLEYIAEVFGDERAEKMFERLARGDKAVKELRVAVKALGGNNASVRRGADIQKPPATNTGHGVKAALSQRRSVKVTKDPFSNAQVLSMDAHVLTITYGQKGWGATVKQAAVADIGDAITAMMDVLKLPQALIDQMTRRMGQETTYDMLKTTVEAQGGTVELSVEVSAI